MNNLQLTTEEELQKYRKTQDKKQVEYIYLNFKSFLYQFAGYLKFQQNPKGNNKIKLITAESNSTITFYSKLQIRKHITLYSSLL